jgi:AcrR family transcriptional regulator
MPGNFKKEDVRIVKTKKALFSALLYLLERHSFVKITVNDICVEAMVSRTAFYTHFQDKYDLLTQWLDALKAGFLDGLRARTAAEMAQSVGAAFAAHFSVLENLFRDADREMLDLLLRFLSFVGSGFSPSALPEPPAPPPERQTVALNFLAGGVLNIVYAQTLARQSSAQTAASIASWMMQLAQTALDFGNATDEAL